MRTCHSQPLPKVLLTGAGGFIGSHIEPRLARFCEVLRHTGTPRPAGTWITGNLVWGEGLTTLPSGIQCVVHTAGLLAGKPEEVFRVNLAATSEILRAMESHAVPRLVFLSTGAVYDGARPERLTEAAPVNPGSAYGSSKLAAEMLIETAVRQSRIRSAVVLRCNTVYGPGSSVGMISTLLRSVAEGRPVLVDGPGTQLREPLHVDDLAELICLSVDAIQTGFSIYNVSGCEPLSILEITTLASTISGRPVTVEYTGRPATTPYNLLLDTGKARRDFGWLPAIGLRQGLAGLWQQSRIAPPQKAFHAGGKGTTL